MNSVAMDDLRKLASAPTVRVKRKAGYGCGRENEVGDGLDPVGDGLKRLRLRETTPMDEDQAGNGTKGT